MDAIKGDIRCSYIRPVTSAGPVWEYTSKTNNNGNNNKLKIW